MGSASRVSWPGSSNGRNSTPPCRRGHRRYRLVPQPDYGIQNTRPYAMLEGLRRSHLSLSIGRSGIDGYSRSRRSPGGSGVSVTYVLAQLGGELGDGRPLEERPCFQLDPEVPLKRG